MKYNDIDKWDSLKELYKATKNGRILQERLDYIWNDGENFIPTGTSLTKVKDIAGKECDKPIIDIKRLINLYGGNQEDWVKRVGKVISEKYEFDVH